MSQENVENLSAMYEAFNRRDFDDALQYMDPELEFNPGVIAPDQDEQFLGHRGWRKFIRIAIEAWETVSVETKERIDTEDGRILCVDLWRFGGRQGIEIERELPTLYTFRDGLLVRIDGFIHKAEALAAAGLREQAMSEENVEIVRQVYEAAARRDTAAVLALYDPEVELDATRLGVVGSAGGIFRGHEGLRSLFGDWHEAWGSIEYDYEELIDAGENVISVVTRHARGRASGIEVEQPFALVWTLREGKVLRVVWFLTHAEALEAAGLQE